MDEKKRDMYGWVDQRILTKTGRFGKSTGDGPPDIRRRSGWSDEGFTAGEDNKESCKNVGDTHDDGIHAADVWLWLGMNCGAISVRT